MVEMSFHTAVEEPWLSVPVVHVGREALMRSTPAVLVTVAVEGQPRLRIDVYGAEEPECHAFQEALAWRGFVVIGFGERLHLVALKNRSVTTTTLGAYFGHVYPTEGYLLAASAERLFCIDSTGNVIWTTELLGCDGVIVNEVSGNVIHGEGEWDPPGDWRPFMVRLVDGTKI